MSRAGWAPEAGGSGPARWQRIASNSQFTRVQTAYRAFMDHCRGCATCAMDSSACSTAERLWDVYKEANGP